MTRDEIIDLAREAGMKANTYANAVNALGHSVPVAWLESFAALVESRTASLSAALLQSKDAQIEACRADAARKTEQLDALLAHCGEGECPTCSEIICPHRDTLHFHHDGCPTCTQQAQAMKEKTP